MATLSMLEIAARTGSDALIGLVEDAVGVAPELGIIPAVPKAGTTYRVTRRTADPTAQFANVGEGVTPSKSTYVQEVKSMHWMDVQLEVPESIEKADDGSIGDLLAQEAAGGLRSAFRLIGKQVYYGTEAGDAKGFVGLESLIEGNSAHEVSGSGTAGSSTSAYLVRLNNRDGVHFKVGNDGAFDFKPWMLQRITKSNKELMAWISNLSSFIGLAVPSALNVYRVKSIQNDTNDWLTDALGNECLAKVPVEKRVGLHWFMNRTAALTLQKARSAVGQIAASGGGAPAFAPTPTELAGVPITITDQLLDTE